MLMQRPQSSANNFQNRRQIRISSLLVLWNLMHHHLEVSKDLIMKWINKFRNRCLITNNYRQINYRSNKKGYNIHNSSNLQILKTKSSNPKILRAPEKARQRAPSTTEYSKIKWSQRHLEELYHNQVLNSTISQQIHQSSETT